MDAPTGDDERFARLCRRGALKRIQLHLGHGRTLAPLTVSAHVLDADAGDLALGLRYGFEAEQSLEAGSPEDREAGARKWISVDGAEAPLLADDASSVLGYSEFSELKSETSAAAPFQLRTLGQGKGFFAQHGLGPENFHAKNAPFGIKVNNDLAFPSGCLYRMHLRRRFAIADFIDELDVCGVGFFVIGNFHRLPLCHRNDITSPVVDDDPDPARA